MLKTPRRLLELTRGLPKNLVSRTSRRFTSRPIQPQTLALHQQARQPETDQAVVVGPSRNLHGNKWLGDPKAKACRKNNRVFYDRRSVDPPGQASNLRQI